MREAVPRAECPRQEERHQRAGDGTRAVEAEDAAQQRAALGLDRAQHRAHGVETRAKPKKKGIKGREKRSGSLAPFLFVCC